MMVTWPWCGPLQACLLWGWVDVLPRAISQASSLAPEGENVCRQESALGIEDVSALLPLWSSLPIVSLNTTGSLSSTKSHTGMGPGGVPHSLCEGDALLVLTIGRYGTFPFQLYFQ